MRWCSFLYFAFRMCMHLGVFFVCLFVCDRGVALCWFLCCLLSCCVVVLLCCPLCFQNLDIPSFQISPRFALALAVDGLSYAICIVLKLYYTILYSILFYGTQTSHTVLVL